MDHFKTFDPHASPFLVECLFDDESSPLSYDNLGFFDFPLRKGWGDAKAKSGVNFHLHSRLEINKFLQSWLYVGFLAEWMSIVGMPIVNLRLVVQGMIRKDDRGCWITTKFLPIYFQMWEMREVFMRRKMSQDQYEQQKKICLGKLGPLLDAVQVMTVLLEGPDDLFLYPTRWHNKRLRRHSCRYISSKLATIIFALRYSIASAAKVIWTLPMGNGMDPGIQGSDFIGLQLLNNGWCPFDVRYLATSLPLDVFYYLSSYHPSRSRRYHGACDDNQCRADVIKDIKEFQSQHVQIGCHCHYSGPKTVPLLEAFGKDGIPLVTVNTSTQTEATGSTACDIVVVPFRPDNPCDYIAFSHVWANGLGNPTANTLPMCQLAQLQGMADALYIQETGIKKSVPFWIDTLCVPVSIELDEYRKIAIQRMRKTYESAIKVLVLDPEIQAGSRSAGALESTARSVVSSSN
jgi:hypothetical protein